MLETLLLLNFRDYISFDTMCYVIFTIDNEMRYLKENLDKIHDVNSMPEYIKLDFYKYQSEPLTLKEFNFILHDIKMRNSIKLSNGILEKDSEIIKSIKRELKLLEIL